MSQNNQKQPEIDGSPKIDLEWELLKSQNRMVDLMKAIEENAVKIRSNSARISRVQASLKTRSDDEEGWEEPEEGREAPEIGKIDFFNSSVEELQEVLNRVTRTK